MTVLGSGGSPVRELILEAWDERRHDRAFVRILAPAKRAGRSYLKLPPNLWKYDPRSKEIARVPATRHPDKETGGAV